MKLIMISGNQQKSTEISIFAHGVTLTLTQLYYKRRSLYGHTH